MPQPATSSNAASRATISPVIMARVAGLTANVSGQLADGSAQQQAVLLRIAETRLVRSASEVSEALYYCVPHIEDKRIRGRIIRLRRAIFKDPNGLSEEASLLGVHLPIDVARLIDTHLSLVREYAAQLASGEMVYCAERSRGREQLRALLQHDGLRRGLQLASPTLMQNVARYSANVGDALFSARDEHIERGLLRYVTRMAFKATPFGAFCTVIRGYLGSGDGSGSPPRVRIQGSLMHPRSKIRLNKELQLDLYKHLIRCQGFRRLQRLALNSTAVIDGGTLRFLSGNPTQECFRCIVLVPAVLKVLESIKVSTCFGNIAGSLANDPDVDAGIEEAEQFLMGLVDIGLLRISSGLDEQDAEWDGSLVNLADASRDSDGAIVSDLLRKLRLHADKLPSADPGRRTELMAVMRKSVRESCAALGLPAEIAERPLIYEDVTADAVMEIPSTPAVRHALSTLENLVTALLPVGGPGDAMACMRHFFDLHYGSSSAGLAPVPLLRFYEDYYREHYQRHLEYQSGRRKWPKGYNLSNPFRLPIIDQRRKARMELEAMAESLRGSGAEEVCITRSDIDRIVSPLGTVPSRGLSFSVFGQILVSDVNATVVLSQPSCQPGHGKYFSRFLYLLDNHTLVETRERNRHLTSRAVFAEIQYVRSFNGNLHPPLLDFEIPYPTGEPTSSGPTVDVTDLDVLPLEGEPNVLILRQRSTGVRIIPVDLGFLSPLRRPPLFRLLRNFLPVCDVVLPGGSTGEPTPGASRPPPVIQHRPRLTYEGAVVLRRRSWTVPEVLFPARQLGEDPWNHFRRVSRWRAEARIPRFVYARVYPQVVLPKVFGNTDQPTDEPQDQRPIPDYGSRDFKKPQYVDFDSPLLVSLLGKLSAGLDGFTVVLEEQLPIHDDLPAADGGPRVCELVLQIDFVDQLRPETSAAS